jgi:hydrogenase-4 component H
MNILQMIMNNFKSGPVTLPFPERVLPAEGLRGLVENDLDVCVGCGTCAYVCSPSAITVKDQVRGYEWRYDPGQCTFCGRCVEYCPMKALSMQGERPPVYSQRSELVQVLSKDYPLCPECGQPARVLPEEVMASLYGDPLPEVIAETRRLCQTCRQRATGGHFIESLAIGEVDHGSRR